MGQTLSPVFRVETISNALPNWIPAPGFIKNAGTTTAASVNPCPSNACASRIGPGWTTDGIGSGTRTGQSMGTTNYGSLVTNGGMIVATALGSQGSIVFTGGGHGDYYIPFVLRFDIATQVWTMLHTPPFNLFCSRNFGTHIPLVNDCTFTGSISGNTLSVTSIPTVKGLLSANQAITGTGVAPGTVIADVAFVNPLPTPSNPNTVAPWTYTLNISQTVASRTMTALQNGYQFYMSGGGDNRGAEGEWWTDATFTTTDPTEPGAFHTYGNLIYLPPGIGGAGAAGALLTLARPALSEGGSETGKRSHIFDLVTNTWARFSTNYLPLPTGFGGYSGGCLDTVRNVIWYGDEAETQSGSLYKLDLTTKAWSVVNPFCNYANYFGTHLYLDALDIVVWVVKGADGVPKLSVFDPVNPQTILHPPMGGVTMPPTFSNIPQGSGFAGTHGGGDWCPDLGKIVVYAGDATTICYALAPPATKALCLNGTTPWNWSAINMTTVAPADQPVIQFAPSLSFHTSRFKYVRVAKTFLWLSGPGQVMNAWRLPGL